MNIIPDEQKDKLPKGKGFYITLAICCTAVVAAGWSTYRSVKDFSGTPDIDTHEHSPKILKENIEDVEDDKDDKSDLSKSKNIKEIEPNIRNKSESKQYYSDNMLADEEDIQSVLSESTNNLTVYPTNNNVIKEFSDGKPVYSKTLGDWRIHDGVDFKAERGSMVKSISDGVVKDIYNDPSYGMTIVIEHNLGFVAYYSGLGDTTVVKKGDVVRVGDEIGSINDVPVEISEDPHLHLMINRDGKFIDPILILDKESE